MWPTLKSKLMICLCHFLWSHFHLIATLFILTFHPLEVVSRWRDSQLFTFIRFDKIEINGLEILLIDVVLCSACIETGDFCAEKPK